MNTTTPSTGLRHTVAAVLLGTVASGLAAVSGAADNGDTLQAVVKYGDLDVSNSEGANTLYSRIRSAAVNVCRPFDNRDFASQKLLNTCIHNAIAAAVNKVDEPALFSIYNAKHGTSTPTIIVASSTR